MNNRFYTPIGNKIFICNSNDEFILQVQRAIRRIFYYSYRFAFLSCILNQIKLTFLHNKHRNILFQLNDIVDLFLLLIHLLFVYSKSIFIS
jgi:hypothetical protein